MKFSPTTEDKPVDKTNELWITIFGERKHSSVEKKLITAHEMCSVINYLRGENFMREIRGQIWKCFMCIRNFGVARVTHLSKYTEC